MTGERGTDTVVKDPSAKRKRVRLHEASTENDIRYRGPLTYQHFQIFGWICIVLSAVLAMMNTGSKLDAGLAREMGGIISVLQYLTDLSLPFLLIANFSKILNNTEGYKKQLITNGCAAAAVAAVSILFFSRYIIGTAEKLVTDPWDVEPVMTATFRAVSKGGFVALNLFIDLFLCTLFMFFLNARPKRILTGKKVLILRAFALLPVAYEAASLVIKFLAARGQIKLPLWSFPLLTVKPPVSFLVFVFLAIHMKAREFRFCRYGRTHEEYQAFLQTKRNSLHFSIYLSVVLLIAAVIDFALMIVMTVAVAPSMETIVNAENETVMDLINVALTVGFGNSVSLAFVTPLMLLYSYSRQPQNKKISTFIPIVGIVLIFILVLEGIHFAADYLPVRKFSLIEVLQTLETALRTV